MASQTDSQHPKEEPHDQNENASASEPSHVKKGSMQQAVTTTNRPAVRFVFVDGLRGLAALSIVIFHIWWYEPAPYPALDDAHWIYDAAFLRI